jgi:DNA-binding HxlR family transcriptional regulator
MPALTDRQKFAKDAINGALELLHRRWMLRVLWELRDGNAFTFRALQSACGDLSPTVLNDRLAELRDAGLLDSDAGGYRLTALGLDLVAAFGPLQAWSIKWWKAQHGRGT